MPELIIYPVDGNPIVAALFLTLITFRWRERGDYIAINAIHFSFSTEELAKKIAEDFRNKPSHFGCNNNFVESTKLVVHPDYGIPDRAAKAVYYAIDAYKDSLVSIDKFRTQLIHEGEEVKNFIKEIEDYLKNSFGRDAIRLELSS